jgi:O-antigen ligase
MAGCNVPAATEAATEEALPLHPHNFAIQIWLELGVLGAIAMAWLIGHLTLRAWRTAPGRFGYATTTGYAVAAFTIASSSYGLWQSWWVAALALGAALGLLCSRVATQQGQG